MGFVKVEPITGGNTDVWQCDEDLCGALVREAGKESHVRAFHTRDPYPVTIVLSRYGGAYEPGQWLAWNLDEESLPKDWDGGDVECHNFWLDNDIVVGAGASPNEALADLKSKVGL